MNQNLANLPAVRIRSLPAGGRGVRLELADASMIEWQPGERTAWRADDNKVALTELILKQALTGQRGRRVTAVGISGDFVYTGAADGTIDVSPDSARAVWQSFALQGAG